MINFLITPILFQYNFLDELTRDAASLLVLDLSDAKKYQQFKISLFINFNRYLMDSLLFLPETEAKEIINSLNEPMLEASETKTLNILNSKLDYFSELRTDFLEIIKTLKK